MTRKVFYAVKKIGTDLFLSEVRRDRGRDLSATARPALYEAESFARAAITLWCKGDRVGLRDPLSPYASRKTAIYEPVEDRDEAQLQVVLVEVKEIKE